MASELKSYLSVLSTLIAVFVLQKVLLLQNNDSVYLISSYSEIWSETSWFSSYSLNSLS